MFWRLFGRLCSSFELWSESKWETRQRPNCRVGPRCFSPMNRQFGPEMSSPPIAPDLYMLWNQDCVNVCFWISALSTQALSQKCCQVMAFQLRTHFLPTLALLRETNTLATPIWRHYSTSEGMSRSDSNSETQTLTKAEVVWPPPRRAEPGEWSPVNRHSRAAASFSTTDAEGAAESGVQ